MNFNILSSLLAPSGMIIAGIMIKISRDKEKFGVFSNYWYWFIIGGGLLLLIRIAEIYR